MSKFRIRPAIMCPHCWNPLETDQLLYISESPELFGDIRLGSYEQARFLPFRINVKGAAMDAHGFPCHKLACPECHLQIPRSVPQTRLFLVSIVGASSAGKSYFIAAQNWQLRQKLGKWFGMNFTDAEPTMNARVREYERILFNNNEDRFVALEKTQVQGDFYSRTNIQGQDIYFTEPYMFSITPMQNHPFPRQASALSQTICMYDNAGESFNPGMESAAQPVTRHLASSDVILFLFDPTQDRRFKNACKLPTNDPQMNDQIKVGSVPQDTILSEMISRIRNLKRMKHGEKHKSPLIIILPKLDAWRQLLPVDKFRSPWTPVRNTEMYQFQRSKVEEMSSLVRKMLLEIKPDVVSNAESFAENVVYIPVSSTGKAPQLENGKAVFRSNSLEPIWAEVPLLYSQILAKKSCVPIAKEGQDAPQQTVVALEALE